MDIELLHNAALLVTAAVVYDFLILRKRDHAKVSPWLAGVIMGGLVVGLMASASELMPGVVFDTRTVLLSIAGLFFGPIPTVMAAVAATAYRWHLGGSGVAMGVATIWVAAGLGLGFRHRLRGRIERVTVRDLYLFGLIVHLGMLACGVWLPASTRWPILRQIALPVMLLYPAATVALGWVMLQFFIRQREQTLATSLAQTREFLSQISDATPAPVVGLDLDGRVTFWNRAAEQVFGYAEQEVVGRPVPLVPASDLERFRRDRAALLEGRPLRRALRQRVRKDGTMIWVRLTNGLLRDPSGKPIGLIAVFEEVTEDVLEERVHRILIEMAGRLPALSGEADLWQTACDVAVRTGGYRVAWVGQFLAAADHQVVCIASAGADEALPKSFELRSGDQTEEGSALESTLRRGDVAVCDNVAADPRFAVWREAATAHGWRSLALVPLFAAGRLWGILGLGAEESNALPSAVQQRLAELGRMLGLSLDLIRARQRLEQQLANNERLVARLAMLRELDRAILEQEDPEDLVRSALDFLSRMVPADRVSVVVVSPDGASGRLFAKGLLAEEPGEARAQPVQTLFPDPERLRQGQATIVREVSEAAPAPFVEKLRGHGLESFANVPGRVGGRLVVVVNLGWCRPGGPDDESIEVARDVADVLAIGLAQAEAHRRQTAELEARVAERTAQLEAANRDLEAFAYSASHDLRAPLRAITGFAGIIARRQREGLDAESRHYFDNILEAARHMDQLITDLLAYSRLGRRPIDRTTVDLEALVRAILRELESGGAVQGAEVVVSSPLPTVQTSPTLLRQALANLIDNALKYRQPGRPHRVEIRGYAADGWAIIEVADNGVGIPPQNHDKVFRIFQRLHSQEAYPGTGIGLAMVHRAVTLMGGTVELESAPGTGSVFRLRIPTHGTAQPAADPRSQPDAGH